MSYFFILISPFLTGVCIFVFILWLWPAKYLHENLKGERGIRRSEALRKMAWLHAVLPLVYSLSQKIESLPINDFKSNLDNKLGMSGRPLGLNSSEFLAITIICSIGTMFISGLISNYLVNSIGAGAVLGFIFGLFVPWFKLDETIRVRIKVVNRELPQAIDLIALAMQAGLDFPGAIDQVSRRMSENSILKFELEHLRHKLSLGYSRQKALLGFADRVKTPTVRQFVAAVVQSEKQGTPIVQVLTIQANVMRTRRSQLAEQAAARAAILILGPLMLIFASVFILLLGPFGIKAMRGELF